MKATKANGFGTNLSDIINNKNVCVYFWFYIQACMVSELPDFTIASEKNGGQGRLCI